MNKQAYEASVRRVLDKRASNEPTMTRQDFTALAAAHDRANNVKDLFLKPGDPIPAARLWGNPVTDMDRVYHAMRGGNPAKYLKKPVIYARDAWDLATNPKYKLWYLQPIAEEIKNPENTRQGIRHESTPYGNDVFAREWYKSHEGPQNIKDYE